jgi:hypothetical protein
MGIQSMTTATTPENQIFTFTGDHTINDLLLVAETLRKTGQKPTLRFVKSYAGDLASVAVDAEPLAPSGEMAVTEGVDS